MSQRAYLSVCGQEANLGVEYVEPLWDELQVVKGRLSQARAAQAAVVATGMARLKRDKSALKAAIRQAKAGGKPRAHVASLHAQYLAVKEEIRAVATGEADPSGSGGEGGSRLSTGGSSIGDETREAGGASSSSARVRPGGEKRPQVLISRGWVRWRGASSTAWRDAWLSIGKTAINLFSNATCTSRLMTVSNAYDQTSDGTARMAIEPMTATNPATGATLPGFRMTVRGGGDNMVEVHDFVAPSTRLAKAYIKTLWTMVSQTASAATTTTTATEPPSTNGPSVETTPTSAALSSVVSSGPSMAAN